MARDMKSALKNSMSAERNSLNDRFSKADKLLGTKTTAKRAAKKVAPKPQEKVIRDAFTMPESDYGLIKTIQDKALKSGLVVNKSELIRAGLRALNDMNTSLLKQAINKVEKVKTGRPKEQ